MVVSVFLTLFLAAQPLRGSETTPGRVPNGARHLGVDVEAWLAEHPAVADAIVWEAPGGIEKPFPTWSAAEKSILIETVQSIAHGRSPELPEAPPLLANDHTDSPPLIAEQARYASEVVWRYHVGYLGQSLAMELGRRLPWSLTDYDAAQLALLLDSRSFFRWDEKTGAYRIPFDLAAATPGDPVRTYEFLRANELLAETRRATIDRVVDWGRRNLIHFAGDWDAANVFEQWQYYGWPPVERTISGTKLASSPSADVRHRSGGCLGTGGFLRIVLRTVNVPVDVIVACPGHGVVHFASENLYISHADDIYHSIMRSKPEIPISELFIDETKFHDWFGGADGRLNITVCKNVGRRIRELMIERLPREILISHCQDRVQSKSPAESSVYQPFRFNYSVRDLQKLGLWDRLEEKVKSLGGCAQIKTGLSAAD
jgi:hypothetical protein